MANVLVEEASLSAIADAIRAKNGTVTTYKPSEMADAITAIEGGGSGSGVWDAVLYKGSTAKVTDSKATAFYGIHGVTSVDLPVCTSIGSYAFYYCSKLTSVDLPVCTTIGSDAFRYCSKLTSVDLPVCTTIGSSAFYYCSSLTSVDLPVCTSIGSYAFYSCSKLTSLYLRSSTLCKAMGSQSFPNSALKIYVPEALLEEYKAASYWSSWASYFASLEEYEANAATASLDDDGISTLELEDTQIGVDELIAAAENDLKTAQELGDPTDYIEERLKELYAERDGTSVDDGTASVDDGTAARPVAD